MREPSKVILQVEDLPPRQVLWVEGLHDESDSLNCEQLINRVRQLNQRIRHAVESMPSQDSQQTIKLFMAVGQLHFEALRLQKCVINWHTTGRWEDQL